MRDKEFDLSDQALSNALAIIQASGKNLSYENQLMINEQFRHNQNALNLLRDIYHSQNIPTVHIDKMLYSPGAMIDHFEKLSSQTFALDGNINSLASEISKLAKHEGAESFQSTPDETQFINSIRQASGLQSNEL